LHDCVKTAELAELLGVSQRSVLNILKKLTDKGLVVRLGTNRDAKYSLKKT
jgi:Mn-dependent DtxR family transcriptional regulator